MKKSEKIALAMLIAVLIVTFFVLTIEANNQYTIFQERRHQVKQPEKIELWMSFSQVSKILEIPPENLFLRLNLTEKINSHINLDLYCKQYHQNCSALVEKINDLKTK